MTFDANGGKLNGSAEVPVYETEKITGTKANDLKAIPNPTRAGYNFTGWYTDTELTNSSLMLETKPITKRHHPLCRLGSGLATR